MNKKQYIMFGFLKKDPVKKLEKKRDEMLEKAVTIQRSGDLKAYARYIEQIEQIEKEIEALNAKKNA